MKSMASISIVIKFDVNLETGRRNEMECLFFKQGLSCVS